MVPVSPIKPITRLDRIHPSDLYRAADLDGERPRWLHLSGTKLTLDKNYSWYGTKKQFRKICTLNEWDALTLVTDIQKRS